MAQAVLLKDVEGLGEAGTAIDVSPGYLRNYLVPRKLAQPATKGALEEAQHKRERAVEAEKQAAERAGETSALLSKTVLTINHRAGEDGKLFGSVTSQDIADAIAIFGLVAGFKGAPPADSAILFAVAAIALRPICTAKIDSHLRLSLLPWTQPAVSDW